LESLVEMQFKGAIAPASLFPNPSKGIDPLWEFVDPHPILNAVRWNSKAIAPAITHPECVSHNSLHSSIQRITKSPANY
jgi:hypothetical protein